MLELLREQHPIETLEAVVSAEEILQCQQEVTRLHVDAKVRDYIVSIVHETRKHDDVALGGSPRASIALFRTAQAMAAIRGREFVLPDDVKRVAPSVLRHRLIVRPESRLRKVTSQLIVDEILEEVPVPVMRTD
jgi:MoxR-like ATPase